ncbi:hypothetical protein vseg_012563 [Gypsophila vaccaria]
MYRKYSSIRISLFILLFFVLIFTLSHHFYRTTSIHSTAAVTAAVHSLSTASPPPPLSPTKIISLSNLPSQLPTAISLQSVTAPVSTSTPYIKTVSILIPDWEVLVIASQENELLETQNYTCVFPNKETSPARFAGALPFQQSATFKCEFPARNRRRLPFYQPQLVRSETTAKNLDNSTPLNALMRWNFIVYDSFTTENDVVLLVKGVNNRQGVNRPPSDFNCLFGDDDPLTAVKTAVTSSVQEVFRCLRPRTVATVRPIAVTLEILENNRSVAVVPSLAKYVHETRRTVEFNESKSYICACTMVYNVAKFLREWVMFHNNIGVDKFILYDNDSDDDLRSAVEELNREGFDVRTVYWAWPKTQEAGFSHCSLYSSQICDWVAYLDVDEFVFSPSWLESPRPRNDMLRSLLPKDSQDRVGQVSIRCNEFGPSNLTAHPVDGVTQGYTCRRRIDQRHKSIVLLDALDHSLLNVVHHFKLKDDYKTIQVDPNQAIVNHYKYQAWPEFQAKFRRRVSAYVIDWRQNLNPMSNDRAPGLGFEAVEPPGWPQKFCEVYDDRMKVLTRRWFELNGSVMAWQSA